MKIFALLKNEGLACCQHYASLEELLREIPTVINTPMPCGQILTWQLLKNYLIEKAPKLWNSWPILWRRIQINRLSSLSDLPDPKTHAIFFKDSHYIMNFSEHYFLSLGYALANLLLGKIKGDEIVFLNGNEFLIRKKDYETILQMQSAQNRLETAPSDRYFKTIRADAQDFWQLTFIDDITQTPKNRSGNHYRKKLDPNMGFTFSADGIYELPKSIKRFSPDQEKRKEYLSSPQSVTLMTKNKTPNYFGHTSWRQQKLVGISVLASDALANRFLIYDGGTVAAEWRNQDIRYVLNYAMRQSKNLYSDLKEFKNRIETDNSHTYNEVLARIRFDEKTSNIVIFSNNFASRCLAQERARSLKNKLQIRANILEQVWDPDYELPIVFYPEFTPYTKEQQYEDKCQAQNIFSDEELLNTHLMLDLDFLYLIDDVNKIFKQENIIELLIKMSNVSVLYNLIDRAWQSNIDVILPFSAWLSLLNYFTLKDQQNKQIDLINYLLNKTSFSIRLALLKHMRYCDQKKIYFELIRNFDFEQNLYKIWEDDFLDSEKECLSEICVELLNSDEKLRALSEHVDLLLSVLQLAKFARQKSHNLKYLDKFLGKNVTDFVQHLIYLQEMEILEELYKNICPENYFYFLEGLLVGDTNKIVKKLRINIHSNENYEHFVKIGVNNELSFADNLIRSKKFTPKICLSLLIYLNEHKNTHAFTEEKFYNFVKNNWFEMLYAKENEFYVISEQAIQNVLKPFFVKLLMEDGLDPNAIEFMCIYAMEIISNSYFLYHPATQLSFLNIVNNIESYSQVHPIQNIVKFLRKFNLEIKDPAIAVKLLERLSKTYKKLDDNLQDLNYLYLLEFATEGYRESVFSINLIKKIDLSLFFNNVDERIIFKALTYFSMDDLILNYGVCILIIPILFRFIKVDEELALKHIDKIFAHCEIRYPEILHEKKIKLNENLDTEDRIFIALYYKHCAQQKKKKSLFKKIVKEIKKDDEILLIFKKVSLTYEATDDQGNSIAYYYLKSRLQDKPLSLSLDILGAIDFKASCKNGDSLIERVLNESDIEIVPKFLRYFPDDFCQKDVINRIMSRHLIKLNIRDDTAKQSANAFLHYKDDSFVWVGMPNYLWSQLTLEYLINENLLSYGNLFKLLLPLVYTHAFRREFSSFWFDVLLILKHRADKFSKAELSLLFTFILDFYIDHKTALGQTKSYTHWHSRILAKSIQTEIQAAQAFKDLLSGLGNADVSALACKKSSKLGSIVNEMLRLELIKPTNTKSLKI